MSINWMNRPYGGQMYNFGVPGAMPNYAPGAGSYNPSPAATSTGPAAGGMNSQLTMMLGKSLLGGGEQPQQPQFQQIQHRPMQPFRMNPYGRPYSLLGGGG